MLWIVGTPIGNRKDLSERIKETLAQCSLILCEDTRKAGLLMQEIGIKKPLFSHHKFNEKRTLDQILKKLHAGEEIALISDAGMPCICDPGEELVKRCRQEGIAVSAVPGPCAFVLALALSGFATIPFQFIGFLEKKGGALRQQLAQIVHYKGTTAAYEAPHRIGKTVQLIAELAPDLELFLAREMTKTYEECLRGPAQHLKVHPSLVEPRGEFVIVFSQHSLSSAFENLSAKAHIALLEEEYGLSRQEAIKLAATLRHLPKKSVYNALLHNE